MCVQVCDWMCSHVWEGSSRAPWGTGGSTSQVCGSLEVPSSQAAWEAAIATVFPTSSGLYSFRKKKKTHPGSTLASGADKVVQWAIDTRMGSQQDPLKAP